MRVSFFWDFIIFCVAGIWTSKGNVKSLRFLKVLLKSRKFRLDNMFFICLLYVFSYVCAYTSTCLYNASVCLITRNGRLSVKFDVFWSFLGDYDKELTNHPFRHFKYFRFQFQNQPNSKKQRKLSKFSNKLEETRHLGEFLIKSTHTVSCSSKKILFFLE